jgi:hypothetical protein
MLEKGKRESANRSKSTLWQGVKMCEETARMETAITAV